MLHRLNLRNETSQENESNINRKPVKSRNPLSYKFLPRKFCLVYKKYFHKKLGKQITIEAITAASCAKRRWKGLRETHLRSKRQFRSVVGESAHITHSAQLRTNVRKLLIICSMTWREASCGYQVPSHSVDCPVLTWHHHDTTSQVPK